MAKIEYKARYRKKGGNPFAQHPPATIATTVEIDEDVASSEVERMAKKATPEGHEFIEVERVK